MKKIIVYLITLYQYFISPLLKATFGGGCRFYPTCSVFTKEALIKFGIVKGTYLSLRRFLRCHPGSKISFEPLSNK